jgi:mediator of RNA polymerase II transcription subunit 16, fungi type
MFLAGPPPAAFLPVIVKLFDGHLKTYRAQTDPGELFFADFRLLEVDDDRRSLAAKKAGKRHVDVFKRIELIGPRGTVATGQSRDGGGGNDDNGAATGASSAMGKEPPLWRRCARCAGVMEDVFGTRPGFTFVLAQQRKCACGGHWTLLSRGKSVN